MDKHANDMDMKIFGLGLTIVASLISLKLFKVVRFINYYALISIAVLIFLLAAFKPKCLSFPYRVWMKIANFISTALTNTILILIFYLVITPIGLVMRLIGKDLLELKRTNQVSYWIKKEDKFDKASYLKQF